ncbi:MAG: (2Fe-2S)-binding protein, partial [Conexivisphaera sp.]
MIRLNINGRDYEADVEPRTLLVDFIRDVAGLKGTHVGCETGSCGSCMVLLDGMPVKSCLMLAAQAQGRRIVTVEGLLKDGRLNRVQEALSRRKALQCGFCAPGFSVLGTYLVERGVKDREELKRGLAGVICRCTGYEPVIEALEEAAGSE